MYNIAMEPAETNLKPAPTQSSNLPQLLVILFLATLSLTFLFRSPFDAGNLGKEPDSGEYAVGAWRLATQGHFNIVLLGKTYPDRYPPGFPALILAPVYHFLPSDLGNGIYGVLIAGLIGVMAAWYIGKCFGNGWCGAFSVLALLLVKDYRLGTTRILSDGTTAVLGLLACVTYLRLRAHVFPDPQTHRPPARYHADYFLAGLLTGVAFTMRYDMVGIVLPFIVLVVQQLRRSETRRAGLVDGTLLMLPVLAGIGTIFAYNALTFGSPLRTGYHYWCAFPYDFPGIIWSVHNIALNLHALNRTRVYTAVIAGVFGLTVLRTKKNPQYTAYVSFLMLACGPAAAAHMLYAYTGSRFFVLPLALLQIAGGVGVASLIPQTLQSNTWVLAAFLGALQPLLPSFHKDFQTTPINRIIVSYLRHNTPDNAVIVSGANPVYLAWYLQRDSHRVVVPVSRDVGYANLLLFPPGRPHPSVLPHIGHVRTSAMLAAGGVDVVPWTAMGQPNRLLALAQTGRPVFVEKVEVPLSYPDPATLSVFTVLPLPQLPVIQLIPQPPH